MNFYKRFMADYAKKTSRLTLAQHGAYTLLLDEFYATEQPLPAAHVDLFRICRAMSRDEQAAVAFVADMFFPIGEDGLRHNERAACELADAAPAMEAARANGKRGGRPKKEPTEFENKNPVGFQNITQNEPSAKAPHSSEEDIRAKALLSASPPDCPHEALIDLFAERLPSLPQPRKSLWLKGKNAPAMRARWRWVMSEKYEGGERKGTRMATTVEEGLAWFDRFFGYVEKSDWLTGRGGKNWTADLAWLVNASNFEKVLQGNYENPVVTA